MPRWPSASGLTIRAIAKRRRRLRHRIEYDAERNGDAHPRIGRRARQRRFQSGQLCRPERRPDDRRRRRAPAPHRRAAIMIPTWSPWSMVRSSTTAASWMAEPPSPALGSSSMTVSGHQRPGDRSRRGLCDGRGVVVHRRSQWNSDGRRQFENERGGFAQTGAQADTGVIKMSNEAVVDLEYAPVQDDLRGGVFVIHCDHEQSDDSGLTGPTLPFYIGGFKRLWAPPSLEPCRSSTPQRPSPVVATLQIQFLRYDHRQCAPLRQRQ